MKSSLITSLLIVAVSSSVAFANSDRYHRQLVSAYHRSQNAHQLYGGRYKAAPDDYERNRRAPSSSYYPDPYGAYDVMPSPVSDQ